MALHGVTFGRINVNERKVVVHGLFAFDIAVFWSGITVEYSRYIDGSRQILCIDMP